MSDRSERRVTRPAWKNAVKDHLTRVGLQQRALGALWRYRYVLAYLSGAFVMRPVPLAGITPGSRCVEVALADLRHRSNRFVWERHYDAGFVFAGNWDQVIKAPRAPLSDAPGPELTDAEAYAHRTVIEMCVEGLPPERTGEYQHLAQRIARGGRPRQCATLDDLDAHFAQLERDRTAIATGAFGRRQADGQLVPHRVKVFVDRCGDLIHRSQGMHQLRMAEFYGVPRVPVEVVAVHIDWLAPFLKHHGAAVPALEDGLAQLATSPAGPVTRPVDG